MSGEGGGEAPRPGEPDPATSTLHEGLAALRLPEAAKDGARRRPPRRGLRLALAVAALLVLLGGAWLALAPRPMKVEVTTARSLADASREPVQVLSGTGYLIAKQPYISVGSRIAGRIRRYLVDEGDHVKKGQALVELDAVPYQATVDQLRASLESARARRVLAEKELARVRHLVADGVTSRDELDQRESEYRVARASVRELQASLARARVDLDDTVIRAPTAGVVLETFKQPGEVAVPGGFSGSGDLLKLANLQEIRAELDVNEADLPRVSMGQEASVVPDAFPDVSYRAKVVKLAPQIDRQKGTRKVEVRVLRPDDRLLPDMSVRVTFLAELDAAGGAAGPGAVIPQAALHRDAAGHANVWQVVAGRAHRVPVEVASTLGDRVVVHGALHGGEKLVVGAEPTHEGQRLEVADVAAAPRD